RRVQPHHLSLRLACRRHRSGRARLRDPAGPPAPRSRDARRLPLRVRLSLVRRSCERGRPTRQDHGRQAAPRTHRLTRMPSLDDLRRIIRRIETRRPPRVAAEPIERVVGGEVVDTGAGSLLVVRREYPLAHRHGRVPLDGVRRAPLDVLARVARVEGDGLAAERLLFLDTETTGLAGGTGTYAFLVGAGWIEGDAFVVTQHFMRDLDEEPALLAALAPLLERAGGDRGARGAGPPGGRGHWVRLRRGGWEKRAARWATACALWDAARQRQLFDPRPWEELAKFHEHRARDFAAARAVVTDALDL